ncbi:MAG: TIGR04211 family SH3 domain-containing protein [Aeromonadaceae bacterium]
MKSLYRPLLLTLVLSQCPAMTAHAAETRYVSDEIYTFLRAGAGKQFRILGSIKAGEAVEVLATSPEGKYVQVRDSKERTGWILAQELQTQESFRLQSERLQQEVAQLKSKLENIDSDQARELKSKSERLSQAESQLQQQSSQLESQEKRLELLQQENQTLKASLGTQERDQLFHWLRQGGLIAGGGLLIGLLIPYLPRPRRRQQDRWLN